MRILLVEDDEMIGRALVQTLRDASYTVDWVTRGCDASAALTCREHDALLLDLTLPDKDGLAVLRELRGGGDRVPVIVLTARGGLEDRIEGLDLGADDYLAKPFEARELLARLRAITRRIGSQTQAVMASGALSLDPGTREARFGLETGRLSAREFALMHALLVRPGVILSRSDLERSIYGWNEEIESNAVEFLIHGIRKKLGACVIKNVRGAGWMIEKDAAPGH